MDDATKQALSEFVRQAVSAAQAGGQWTAEQAPLLVQEWLRWVLIDQVIGIVFVLLLGYGANYVAKLAIDYGRTDHEEVATGAGWVLRVLAGFFVLFIVGSNLSTIAKVIVAPRVVVIEKLSDLLK